MKLHLEQSEPQQGVQKSRKVRRSQSWAKAKEKLVLVAVNNLLWSSVIISSSYFGFCRLLKRTWLHMMRYIRKYISKLHVVIVFMGAELSVVVNRIKSSIMQPFPVSVVIHRQPLFCLNTLHAGFVSCVVGAEIAVRFPLILPYCHRCHSTHTA